ncbi:hypothetical protein [Peredibacter starrii]|uniref:Uncharacterized protein n=1 Tax=Peredibacter starrii TaxID=28202 RepID=A0AAX4HQX9_9BACT|nr:hypothetical protein [Peredibacter starrii]WPU65627.1 hypothetical protein SOO65_02585 [Peredibacter starrii]
MSEDKPAVELLPVHGYNHAMLYLNILDKHYICVSRARAHIDPHPTSASIYIGEYWKDITFSHFAPLFNAGDFFEFIKHAQREYGGLANLLHSEKDNAIKIYVGYDTMVPFFLYSLVQIDQTFGLSHEILRSIIKKTNERFWIWDNKRLNLSVELYRAFKDDIGEIPECDLLFKDKTIVSLPFEYVFLFYAHGKISKQELKAKFQSLKSYMVGMSLIQVVKSGLETLLNDARVLKDFKGIDIEAYDDIVPILEEDELLNGLFIKRISTKDVTWVEERLEEIKFLMSLLKAYDLDSHDPFPSYDEFKKIQEVYYGPNQDKALDEILSGAGPNLHELDFFKEYTNKMNTTLIHYVSVKLARKDQVVLND